MPQGSGDGAPSGQAGKTPACPPGEALGQKCLAWRERGRGSIERTANRAHRIAISLSAG